MPNLARRSLLGLAFAAIASKAAPIVSAIPPQPPSGPEIVPWWKFTLEEAEEENWYAADMADESFDRLMAALRGFAVPLADEPISSLGVEDP